MAMKLGDNQSDGQQGVACGELASLRVATD
jgi:hypothetical protein